MRFAIASAVLAAALLMASKPGSAGSCPDAPRCRDGGNLVYKENSHHTKIYTVNCPGGPGVTPRGEWSNSSPATEDKLCLQLARCPAAGGFGRFLASVTEHCTAKHFDGYFGLDGMTFGILDFTSVNLPSVVQAYRTRNSEAFDRQLGKLNLPIENGCWNTSDVCERNKAGSLMCRADFNSAFKATLEDADFRKAQIDVALKAYDRRISGAAAIGLKTEYGAIAIATVENGLKGGTQCRPETWKQACRSSVDETHLVHCMLDQYAAHDCRGGSPGAAALRRNAINKEFAGTHPSANIHPTIDQILSCSTDWGEAD